jgi:glutaredoxin
MMYTVWGQTNCAACSAAKDFLTENNEEFTYVELGVHNFDKFLELTNGAKSVPQIFDSLDGLIGDYKDLVEFYNTTQRT